MSVIVSIEGRDAIPVRAIPLITGWSIAPPEVANYLAQIDGPPFQFFHDVSAFHLQAGAPIKILAKEWDAVRDRFAALEATLRANHSVEAIGRDRWIDQSIDELPANVFVWRDDFERAWSRLFPIPAPNERLGDRVLNYEAIGLTTSAIASKQPSTSAPLGNGKETKEANTPTISVESEKVGAGEAATSRTAARIEAIVETATRLQYDPLSVPYGGKATIEHECLETLKGEPHRFTAATFKSAWQAARDAKRIEVQNVETYRGQ